MHRFAYSFSSIFNDSSKRPNSDRVTAATLFRTISSRSWLRSFTNLSIFNVSSVTSGGPVRTACTVAIIEVDTTPNIEWGQADAGVQTDKDSFVKPAMLSSYTQTCTEKCILCIENFVADGKRLQFYTGLDNHTMFITVLSSLGPAAYQLELFV
jgi:hypothetical protein